MSTPKKPTEKNPFELILDDMTKTATQTTTTTTGLNFSNMLKANNRRKTERNKATGTAQVFDEENNFLTQAVFRNITPNGLGVETLNVKLNTGQKVSLVMGGAGGELGKIKAEVVWVSSLDDHPKKHKMVGIQFTNPTAEFSAKFKKFIQLLSKPK